LQNLGRDWQWAKRMIKKMDMEIFNLKQLNGEEVKEQYQVIIKNMSAALENLDDNGYISRAWDTIRENIKILAKESIGLYESKSYKPWFDECLKLVDRRKGVEVQWFQVTCEVNEDNLSNVRILQEQEKEYLKGKNNEIELNSKTKNIRDLYRGINEFKKGYQPFLRILNKF
jgi:hypothetical protein